VENYSKYVNLLSYIEETNRCPGGKRTINEILLKTLLFARNKKIKVLEIGSNTGFTSIEIAKVIDAEIVGIDVNENAVRQANVILNKESNEVSEKVTFQVGDATNIDFEDDYFDLIITGGANTFIRDREQAIKEYKRVLKPNGFLAITNLFYNKKVPVELLENLKNILDFEIKPWKREYWLDLFLSSNMELYFYDEQEMQSRSEEILESYIEHLMSEYSNKNNDNEIPLNEIKEKWTNIMRTFNDNHKYLSYMIVILRNNTVNEQQEFFIEKGTIDPWNLEVNNKFW